MARETVERMWPEIKKRFGDQGVASWVKRIRSRGPSWTTTWARSRGCWSAARFGCKTGTADSRTLLHTATATNATAIVRFLLARGADVNARNRWGMGVLSDAVRASRTHMLVMLVRAGADPNEQDDKGSTPLFHALGTDSKETGPMIRELIRLGGRPGPEEPALGPVASGIGRRDDQPRLGSSTSSRPRAPIPPAGAAVGHAAGRFAVDASTLVVHAACVILPSCVSRHSAHGVRELDALQEQTGAAREGVGGRRGGPGTPVGGRAAAGGLTGRRGRLRGYHGRRRRRDVERNLRKVERCSLAGERTGERRWRIGIPCRAAQDGVACFGRRSTTCCGRSSAQRAPRTGSESDGGSGRRTALPAGDGSTE